MALIYEPKITVSWNSRLCEVDGEFGYFQTWELYSRPLEASPLIGGAPAGVFGQTFGIVEFENGVRRVDPVRINFCDEENESLKIMNSIKKEKEHDSSI